MDDFFYHVFDNMPRLAPGTVSATLKAFSKVQLPGSNASVLDIGCGTGVQTIALAKKISGKIIALDNHQPFLDTLKLRTKSENLKARIEYHCRDMNAMEFGNNSFDLVWAEGSIYIMGFKAGLEKVHSLLKPSGYAVFSEMNWTADDPPDEIVEFFNSEYPEMLPIEKNIELIKNNHFELVEYFKLDKEAHWEPYYKPLEQRLKMFRKSHSADPSAMNIITDLQYEIDMYKKYSGYYGYCFYVMKKA